jgi:YVTN family beta-propeller protein
MKFRICALALLASFSLPLQTIAQSAPGSLLVLSKRDHTLAVVDPSTLKVSGKAPVGDDPHEVIASSDGRTAYVSNYGGGAFHTLAVIDLAGPKALPSIDLDPLHGPHGLTFVDGKLWFTAEGSKVIGRFDPVSQKVDWVLGTGQNRTHMVYVSPDVQRIVTTNVSSGTVSLMALEEVHMGPPPGGSGGGPMGGPPQGQHGPPQGQHGPPPGPPGGGPPRKDWNETVVKVGNGSEGFDVAPDGKEVWVANAQDGTVSIIDIAKKSVVATLNADVQSANRLKFTLDGRYVLISTLGGTDLVILDAHTRKEMKRVAIGHGAAGIVMQPDGARAFVACTADDYVAVIDLKTFAVAGHIDAGGEPDGMAWASR